MIGKFIIVISIRNDICIYLIEFCDVGNLTMFLIFKEKYFKLKDNE